jgi:GTP-binding protein YchF
MKVAIVGLPQSGKTTVFSAVTEQSVDPYAPPEPRHAIVHVPEPRLELLAQLCHPRKVIEATMEFIDIPGFSIEGAKGQEEMRKLLPEIRQAELLALVVRDFENASVPAYRDRIDAEGDLAALWDELIFADLDAVTTRVERLEKSLKKPAKTHEQEKRELALMTCCLEALESNEPIATAIKLPEEQRMVSSFAFLTQKPMICIRNVSDDEAAASKDIASDHVEATITLSASIEAEIARLEPEDRAAFMSDLGLTESARERLLHTCYQACGLISFLTMGPEAAQAWAIHQGSTALDAAAKVHTDLAHGFIRAETVAYDDLLACGDMKSARAAGKVRKEGKTYVVADGDVINILSSA